MENEGTLETSCRLETLFLADQLERTFQGGAWHGPAVLEVLRRVDQALAARPCGLGPHTIWEIATHIGAWVDVARRRIEGEAIHDLTEEESWPALPEVSQAAWQKTLDDMEVSHCRLHRAVMALCDDQLNDTVAGSDPTIKGLILGVLQHNAYHAGQIVVLEKAARGAQ